MAEFESFGVAGPSIVRWDGEVWRAHSRRYPADDPGGSLRVSGRYNRGRDRFREPDVWPALYTSVSDNVCTWEMLRHFPWDNPTETRAKLANTVYSRLRLLIEAALDLRDPSVAGLSVDDLCREGEYHLTQAIGAAALAAGLEALLVPSATGVGLPGANYNVVVLTSNVQPTSRIEVIDTLSPRLPS